MPLQCDKFRKAFSYLEAAMYFVESGIAIERDPQISTSSYTMFAETVELLKYEPSSLLCIIAGPQSAGFTGLLLPFFSYISWAAMFIYIVFLSLSGM